MNSLKQPIGHQLGKTMPLTEEEEKEVTKECTAAPKIDSYLTSNQH